MSDADDVPADAPTAIPRVASDMRREPAIDDGAQRAERYIQWYKTENLNAFIPQADLDRLFRTYIHLPLRAERAQTETSLVQHQADAVSMTDGANRYDARRMAMRSFASLDTVADTFAIADELQLMAVYKALERARTGVLAQLCTESERHKLADWRFLVTRFPELQQLVGSAEIDELRLINNCIKHSGHVSRALSKCHEMWLFGEPLTSIGDAYARLAPYVGAYWVHLLSRSKTWANADASAGVRVAY